LEAVWYESAATRPAQEAHYVALGGDTSHGALAQGKPIVDNLPLAPPLRGR